MNEIVSPTLNGKFTKLKESLKAMNRVIIAFSGGVDSTFLLKAATLAGLDRVIAVTGISESLPQDELAFASGFAASLDVGYRTLITEELRDANYVKNPPDRCYYCKKELFSRLRKIADEEDIPFILDGTNADDAKDWRPGRRAAQEEGVQSPLLDAKLSKQDIRELSRSLGLATWDKPAAPCLSSRFPYGQKITPEALERVSRAEDFIRKLGIKEFRVRDHSEVARIEVPPEEFKILTNNTVRNETVAFLKAIGYKYVTLDLQGFRSGSGNEVLKAVNAQDSRGQVAEGASGDIRKRIPEPSNPRTL